MISDHSDFICRFPTMHELHSKLTANIRKRRGLILLLKLHLHETIL